MEEEESIPDIRSRQLREDNHIKLSCGSFEELHKILVRQLDNKHVVYKMKSMNPYPSHETVAQFASMAYLELDKKQYPLPSGWKLLTTARNHAIDNGYFGAVFLHSDNYHVLIAHRGTDIFNPGALYTDNRSVIHNHLAPQMDSACTLAIRVNSILREIEIDKNDCVQFQLFFTGHSLGGWLAQITTFATEYLDINQTGFLNVNTVSGSMRHAHAVAFESPGCKPMLSMMKREFGRKYDGQFSLKALDITIVLSDPNIINSIAEHVVQPCRIQEKNYTDLKWWEKIPLIYIWRVHKMQGILQALQQENPQMFAVLDWPITTVSRYFANWRNSWLQWVPLPVRTIVNAVTPIMKNVAKKVAIPWRISLQNECELMEYFDKSSNGNRQNCDQLRTRYKIEPIDAKKRNLQIFTKSEREFLETYMVLRKFPNHCKSDALFAMIHNRKHRKQVQKSLGDFTIENNQISCKHAMLELFIPYVQQLLYSHSDLLDAVKQQSSEYTIRKELYQAEHSRFWESYKHLCPDFKETYDRMDFRIWQVITEDQVDMHIMTMKIYKHVEYNAKDATSCTVLTLKQMLLVDKTASFKDLIASPEMSDHLFIIECKQDRDTSEEPQKLFQCIRNAMNEKPNIKFIFVTRKNDNFMTIIQDEYKDKPSSLYRETENGLCWDDLHGESQNELLTKNVVCFNGQQTCLNDLVNISDVQCSTIIDSATLTQLIKGEHIKLGDNQQRLSELPAAFSSIYKEIPQTILKDALMFCPEESLFLVTSSSTIADIDGLMERLNIKNNYAKTLLDKIVLRCGLEKHQNDQAWQTICREHRNETIFWVEVTAHRVFCQQIYDPTFYFSRHLCLIDMKSELKEIVKSNKTSDAFILSNISDKMQLVQLLGISEHDLKDFIFFANTEISAENLFNEQSKCHKSVHWLKIDQEGHLIWFRTHGHLHLLRECKNQKSDSLVVVKEEMFWKNDFIYKDRAVIVAGAPGMGKSTTLTSLSEHINGMTIRRDLMNCNHAIAGLPLDKLTVKHVTDFVSKTETVCPFTPLFYSLLALELDNANKIKVPIHFMFDGFDEIDYDSRKRILKLLQFLKENTTCNIWVTTRSHHQKHLEDHLSVFAITFKEADQDAQKSFLHKFWKIRYAVQLANQCDDIDGALFQHATDLLVRANEMFGKETSNFMGVPLQLRMLAEAYPPNLDFVEDASSTKFSNCLHEADLFQRFIEMKYDIYFREKIGFGNNLSKVQRQWFTESLLKKHRILAFHTLFPRDAEKLLHRNLQDCINHDLMNLNELGWIQSNPHDGNFSFIHRSFAEYFVADLIWHWLQKPQGRHQSYQNVENFILSHILLKPAFKVIRLFLDGLLAKSTPQTSQCEFYKNRIATILAEKQDMCYNTKRQTAIYIAAEENRENLLKFLLGSFSNMHEDLAKLLSWRDKNGETVLYVAADATFRSKELYQDKLSGTNCKYLGMICQILQSMKDFPNALQEKIILETCFRSEGDQCNPILLNLLEVVECHSHLQNIVQEIREKWKLTTTFLKCVLENQVEHAKSLLDNARTGKNGEMFKRFLIASTNNHNKTALYLAAQAGHSEIVRILISEGADVNSNYDSVTPLHAAAENMHLAVVTLLLESNANLNAVDKAQKTPLHYAVASGGKAVVSVLLQNGASPRISNQDPFHCSPESFEMNAKTLDQSLPYCLFSKQFHEMPRKEMSDIADCYNMVINKSIECFGPQDMRTLTAQATLAKVLFKQGNYPQSLDVYQNILNGISETIDPGNNVLQIQSSIAQILSKIGQHDKALPLYEDVFEKRLKLLGLNHRETLLAKHNIAKILSYQGKYEEALLSYRKVSEYLSQNRANYHDTLITKHNTAQLLAYMGKYRESVSLFKRNHSKFSRSFGKNHAFTLITTLNIAQMHSNSGAYEEALKYYDICINSKQKVGWGCDGKTFKITAEHDKERTRVQLANMNNV